MVVGRIARRIGVDHNPLRRRSDRVEAWLTLAMVVVILVAAPVTAWRAADATYRDSARAVQRERHQRTQASATLTEDAPTVAQGDDDVRGLDAVAQARWTAPDGTRRTGLVAAPPGQRAGTTVVIWTDVHGGPTRPPVEHHPATNALAAGILAICGVIVGAVGGLMLVRWRLNRRRFDEWQVEWMFVEPVWSGRRRLTD